MANLTCSVSPKVLVGGATSLGDTTNLELKLDYFAGANRGDETFTFYYACPDSFGLSASAALDRTL